MKTMKDCDIVMGQQPLYVHTHARTVYMLEKLDSIAKMRKHSNLVVFM